MPEGDALASVRRGMIVPAADLGLRQSQRRPFRYDAYNGGCLGVNGCVPGDGYACQGPTVSGSSELQEAFAFLNAPFAPDDFESKPPKYMIRHPAEGPDSVVGWGFDGGRPRWKAALEKIAKGVEPPEGCPPA